MGEAKKTELSIIVRTVDAATAKIKAINEKLDEVTKPARDFGKQLSEFGEKSGLNKVSEGFHKVGEAAKESLLKLLEVGLVIGETVHLVLELVESFAELGEKAKRLGVGVDFLAQMRDSAQRSGAAMETLDQGMQAFAENLGQMRAGTGRMLKFLNQVSPALARQLKGAKSNEEAFYLLSDAMAKVTDPAKRLALAQKTVGNSDLAPMLARGSKALKEMGGHYTDLAGDQQDAAEAAGETHEAMLDMKAATDGVKAALVQGLAPALTIIIKKLSEWLAGHRQEIREWAESLGTKLPAAAAALADAVTSLVDMIAPFIEKLGGAQAVAFALAAVVAGPLISAVVALGVALLTTPVGWVVAGLAAITAGVAWLSHGMRVLIPAIIALGTLLMGLPLVAIPTAFITAATLIVKYWSPIGDFFSTLWDGITMVFSKAWDFIKAIVDKVVGAASKVKEAGEDLSNAVHFRSSASLSAAREKAGGEAMGDKMYDEMLARKRAEASQAKVAVEFKNAPPGTRVAVDPKSTADVDLGIGYQMMGLLP